jgi:hypothetical protein
VRLKNPVLRRTRSFSHHGYDSSVAKRKWCVIAE